MGIKEILILPIVQNYFRDNCSKRTYCCNDGIANLVGRRFIIVSSIRGQAKRVNEGNGVAVGVGEAVQGDCIGDRTGNDIRIDESLHLRGIVTCPHIDEAVVIRYNTVPAVIPKDHLACAGSLEELTVSIILKGVRNNTLHIGNGNGTASAVEMVGLELVVHFLANQTSAVDILGGYTVCGLAKEPAESAVGVIGVGGIFTVFAKIADPYILGVIGVGVAVSGNKPVGRVVSKALLTVAKHIAVHIIRYSVAVEHHQTVVRIILEAAVRSLDNVTRTIVGEALAGKDFVTFVLNRAASYSVQVIISITRSGVICKMFSFTVLQKQP